MIHAVSVGPSRVPSLEASGNIALGNHRIVAAIEDQVLRVLVVRVGHRRDVYRNRETVTGGTTAFTGLPSGYGFQHFRRIQSCPILGMLIMSCLRVTASGMVKDGVVPWRDLKRRCPASPLKNALSRIGLVLEHVPGDAEGVRAKPRDFVAETGELLAEREDRSRRRFLTVGLRVVISVVVLPQYRVPDEAAGACLSGQAPCVGPGAWQKPVDDVAVCGRCAHAVGRSAQGSSGDGKGWLPVTRSLHDLPELSRNSSKVGDQEFPIPATGEIGRNLVAEPHRQPIYISPI